jgi:hypothetical protein
MVPGYAGEEIGPGLPPYRPTQGAVWRFAEGPFLRPPAPSLRPTTARIRTVPRLIIATAVENPKRK